MPIEFQPLTLTPINFSLTAGTAIPAPLESPPRTPVLGEAKPATTVKPSVLRESASNPNLNKPKQSSSSPRDNSKLVPPLSPISASSRSSHSRSLLSGVRRFWSIGSRNPNHHHHHSNNPAKLQKSVTPPSRAESSQSRPASPLSSGGDTTSIISDNNTSLRHKRSNGWFHSTASRRKNGPVIVAPLDERLATQSKLAPPPPTLPELPSLTGPEIGGEELFKDIGNNISIQELEIAQKERQEQESLAALSQQHQPTVPQPSDPDPSSIPLPTADEPSTEQQPELSFSSSTLPEVTNTSNSHSSLVPDNNLSPEPSSAQPPSALTQTAAPALDSANATTLAETLSTSPPVDPESDKPSVGGEIDAVSEEQPVDKGSLGAGATDENLSSNSTTATGEKMPSNFAPEDVVANQEPQPIASTITSEAHSPDDKPTTKETPGR